MNRREKILAIGFGGVLVVGVFFTLVYPSVVAPMFDYGGRMAAAEAERDELEAESTELKSRLTERYHSYVLRTGSTEASVVAGEVLQRINTELSDARMEKGSTVTPRTPSADRRTKVATLRVSVSAPGKFAQCIQFIRGVYRMPYIVRFNSIKLSPIGKPQQKADDRVKLEAEIEVTILPLEKLLGAPSDDESQPYRQERLAFKDYSRLEAWKPFIPYSKPSLPKPTPGPVATPKPTPPPLPPGAPTDPYADSLIVRGRIGYGVDEVMLFNAMDEEISYVAVGEEFDAGELVLAHSLGAVAHKVTDDEDFGYFVYPLGQSLAECMKLENASQWPEIQVAMMQYFDARRADLGSPPPNESGDAEDAAMDRAKQLENLDSIAALDSAAESAFVGPPYLMDLNASVATGDDATTTGERASARDDTQAGPNGKMPQNAGQKSEDTPHPEDGAAVQDEDAKKGVRSPSKASRQQRPVRPLTRRKPS